MQTLAGGSKPLNSVAFNKDSDRVVSASKDGTVRVWSLVSNMEELHIFASIGESCIARFNDTGDAIAVSCDDEINFYDSMLGMQINRLVGHDNTIIDFQISQEWHQ